MSTSTFSLNHPQRLIAVAVAAVVVLAFVSTTRAQVLIQGPGPVTIDTPFPNGVSLSVSGPDNSVSIVDGADILGLQIQNGDVTVSGGTITGLGIGGFFGSGKLTVDGGEIFGQVFTADEATASIVGGDLDVSLSAIDSSEISIFGQGFNFQPGPIQATSGTITGVLLDGSPFSANFDRGEFARIIIAVPEPSGLTILLLATGTLLRRRRSV